LTRRAEKGKGPGRSGASDRVWERLQTLVRRTSERKAIKRSSDGGALAEEHGEGARMRKERAGGRVGSHDGCYWLLMRYLAALGNELGGPRLTRARGGHYSTEDFLITTVIIIVVSVRRFSIAVAFVRLQR
jgi:hypothetical protein